MEYTRTRNSQLYPRPPCKQEFDHAGQVFSISFICVRDLFFLFSFSFEGCFTLFYKIIVYLKEAKRQGISRCTKVSVYGTLSTHPRYKLKSGWYVVVATECVFKTRRHCLAQAGSELSGLPKLALRVQSSCLCCLSARIMGRCYDIQLHFLTHLF